MYLMIEENPNCQADERVFPTHGKALAVKKVHLPHPETREERWWDITGVTETGLFQKATAQKVDDSSDGTAWVIFGSEWGLRLKAAESNTAWSLADKTQWGLPFLVLDSSGSAIEFE